MFLISTYTSISSFAFKSIYSFFYSSSKSWIKSVFIFFSSYIYLFNVLMSLYSNSFKCLLYISNASMNTSYESRSTFFLWSYSNLSKNLNRGPSLSSNSCAYISKASRASSIDLTILSLTRLILNFEHNSSSLAISLSFSSSNLLSLDTSC